MMKFLPFIFRHLSRHWIRTGSTVVAMALCVFLFCTLQSVLAQLDRLIEGRSPRRLVARNGISVIFGLPLIYAERIQAVPGVKRVAATTIFGGLLMAKKEGKAEEGSEFTIDWTNVFSNAAVDAKPYFAMSPELMVPEDQFREFMRDLQGCVMGRQLAEKFGWRIGDRFFLQSFVAGLRKKSGPFEFVVRGFIDTDLAKYPATETNLMFFHHRYMNEGLGPFSGTGLLTIELDDPARAGEVSSAIDALFENSSNQTLTETEKAFMAEFMSMAGNLTVLLNGIGLAVSFAILLVTANTMSMAVRERRTEIAVLKTLGYTSAQVTGLILAEALLLGALSGALGLGGTQLILWALNRVPGTTLAGLSAVELRLPVALLGFGAALLLGLAAGFMPAWSAYRARITDTLRTV